MNALRVDPKTGFLESPSVTGFTFTAEKKTRFLELMMTEKQAGRMPNLSDLCDVVGISMTAVDRHIREDPVFKSAWDEIVLRADAQAISDCWDLRKKNPMFLFGAMRRLMPSRWNPDAKLHVSVEHSTVGSLIDKAKAVDIESSPAIAPQNEGLPSREHILTKDIEGKS